MAVSLSQPLSQRIASQNHYSHAEQIDELSDMESDSMTRIKLNARFGHFVRWLPFLLALAISGTVFLIRGLLQEASIRRILNHDVVPPMFAFEGSSPENVLPRKSSRPGVLMMSNLSKIFIDDYVKWHRDTLDAIHAGKLDARHVKVLVHWSDKGIGDRFRGLMNAYMMAVFSNRLFLIKWEEPFPLSRIFRLGKRTNFTYDAKLFGGENYSIPTKDFKSPSVGFKRFLNDTKLMMVCNWDLNSLRLFIVNIPQLYPELDVSKKVTELGDGRLGFQSKRHAMFKLLLQAIFVPTKEYAERVSAYLRRAQPDLSTTDVSDGLLKKPKVPMNRFAFGVPKKPEDNVTIDLLTPYIGVHIRLGNNTKELYYHRFRHQMSPNDTAACLSTILMREADALGMNPPRFFLATDAPKLRPALATELRKRNSSAELYYGDWDVKHVKHMNNSSDDLATYFNTFLELYMLSHSRGMVASNSAFNDLACFWGDVRRKKRFDIEKCPQF